MEAVVFSSHLIHKKDNQFGVLFKKYDKWRAINYVLMKVIG